MLYWASLAAFGIGGNGKGKSIVNSNSKDLDGRLSNDLVSPQKEAA